MVVDTLNGTDQPGTFDIAGLLKDLTLAIDLAGAEGANLPLAMATETRLSAAVAEGLGRFDGASLTQRTAQG